MTKFRMIPTVVKKSRGTAELIQPVIADFAIMVLCFKFKCADNGRITGERVNAGYRKDFSLGAKRTVRVGAVLTGARATGEEAVGAGRIGKPIDGGIWGSC